MDPQKIILARRYDYYDDIQYVGNNIYFLLILGIIDTVTFCVLGRRWLWKMASKWLVPKTKVAPTDVQTHHYEQRTLLGDFRNLLTQDSSTKIHGDINNGFQRQWLV